MPTREELCLEVHRTQDIRTKTTSNSYLAIAEIVSISIILNPYRREDMLKNEIVPSSRTCSMLFLF